MGGMAMPRLFESKKKIILLCLGLFLLLSAVNFGVAFTVQSGLSKLKMDEVVAAGEHLLDLQLDDLSSRVGRAVADTLYLADRAGQMDADTPDLYPFKLDLIAFLNRKQVYDHIHLYDTTGRETVRIVYNADCSYAKSDSALTDMADDTAHFAQASALQSGQVAVSRLTLLTENGQLVKPVTPVIVLSAPVFHEDRRAGVLSVIYNARYMLSEFRDNAATGEGSMYLVNGDGYYLSNGDDRDTEFAFLYGREDQKFQAAYPDAWAQMALADSGAFMTPAGQFIYTAITPYSGSMENGSSLYAGSYYLEEGDWYAVSYLSTATLAHLGIFSSFGAMAKSIFQSQWQGFAALLLLALVASVALIYKKVTKDRMRYFSERDVLTGLYNRRAGMSLLEKSCRDMMREHQPVTVCFVDVDGLKQVNDCLGHEKGDELLVCVAHALRQSIRQQDFVTRLGGDEFLIVFLRTEATAAEAAWQRVLAAFARLNEGDRPYLVSASHGVSVIHPDVKPVIDEVINAADKKMYLEKHSARMSLKVIKADTCLRGTPNGVPG